MLINQKERQIEASNKDDVNPIHLNKLPVEKIEIKQQTASASYLTRDVNGAAEKEKFNKHSEQH